MKIPRKIKKGIQQPEHYYEGNPYPKMRNTKNHRRSENYWKNIIHRSAELFKRGEIHNPMEFPEVEFFLNVKHKNITHVYHYKRKHELGDFREGGYPRVDHFSYEIKKVNYGRYNICKR